MRPNEILKHVRREPFRPFRLHLSGGASHEVHHPELIYVGRTEVVVAVELGSDDVPERSAYCDPIHVTHIEPINGTKPKRRRAKRG
ncbi:MAG: hypothetical protein JXQ73_28905 [Phycisphaerae bacterium]|nr:hypothetical protein [Phycisphaerae bacterium]